MMEKDKSHQFTAAASTGFVYKSPAQQLQEDVQALCNGTATPGPFRFKSFGQQLREDTQGLVRRAQGL